jgi:adenylate cyclase
MTTTRRLAAIMTADVAGFSAAMERDEEGTFAQVQELRRKIIEPKIEEHSGRLVKTTGDGFLAEFASPIAAMRCALAIQAELEAAPLKLRIGLNLGDVIVEANGDVYGEGVNVAARLEALADRGGILVSAKVHSEVEGKVEVAFEDRGEQQVKNIVRPVRVYAVRRGGVKDRTTTATLGDAKPLPLPDKPSIAVLPFQNMSGDPEQEYFADGMAEDITTALSRFKSLFVIARNSAFTYKGKAVDVRQVGRELGVRYVLEGSVRKAGGQVRITGQLVEAATGAHLWADKFDGALEDIFDLQDKVTTNVVGAIIPKLDEVEIAALKRKPPDSWNGYDHYLRGRALLLKQRPRLPAINEAELEFRKAITLDPEFAPAYALAAYSKDRRRGVGATLTEAEVADAARLAARAVELAGDDGEVLAFAAASFANVNNQTEHGAALAARAVSVNPNASMAWLIKGWTDAYRNDLEKASDAFDQTIRLNPFGGEDVWHAMFGKSWVSLLMGRTDEGLAWAERMITQRPNNLTALLMLEGSYFASGRVTEAKAVAERIRTARPDLRASWIRQVFGRAFSAEHLTVIDQNMIDRLGLPE